MYVLVCKYTFLKGYLATVLVPFGKLILQRQGSINAGGGQKQSRDDGGGEDRPDSRIACMDVALEREGKRDECQGDAEGLILNTE